MHGGRCAIATIAGWWWGQAHRCTVLRGVEKAIAVHGRGMDRFYKESCASPEDVAATVLHALGIDPLAEYYTSTGRPITLVRDGHLSTHMF